MKNILGVITILLATSCLLAQDATPRCAADSVSYNDGGFSDADFVGGGQGLLFGDSLTPDAGGAVNTEQVVFPTDQPFVVDYLSEGAGANHLLGFFFFDIDTNKNGFPDFYEVGPNDDLDGDGLINSEDDDIDGDGILNAADDASAAGVTISSDPALFRNGPAAAAAGSTPGDYWEFVPSNRNAALEFEHPGAYLYVDDDNNGTPDVMQYTTGGNRVPPMALNKTYSARHAVKNDNDFPGLLGRWFYSGTGAGGDIHWTGSTIFKLADDDGGTGVRGEYTAGAPYGITDIYDSANAEPDYNIYNTTNPASTLIPNEAKFTDNRGRPAWRYRWYEGNVSGGREYVFFLVVFYPSGSSNVNVYYSKSGFNQDTYDGHTGLAPDGDAYGGSSFTNWMPRHQNVGDHNLLAQDVFGLDWNQVVDTTQGTPPVAFNAANQDWVDKWENYTTSRRVVQYRSLSNWFNATPVDANTIINGRYNIDMSAETSGGLVRVINGNMAHMLVGAPEGDPEAWLLGWEDLFGGGDIDYEDVVFYVKREASGIAQSLNVASSLDQYEDVSITSIEFTYVDNFTDDLWGTEGTYINYAYRLASNQDWIYLLGGEHLRTPDVFTTTLDNGQVTRHVVINLDQEGARELYWKVEMKTADTDSFVPEVHVADVGFEALVHDMFFNSAVIASSNVDYFGAYESPRLSWRERGKNRGHVYGMLAFNHGVVPTTNSLPGGFDFLAESENDPSSTGVLTWDAGIAMRDQTNRRIYAFTNSGIGGITRRDFVPILDSAVINEMELSSDILDGKMVDNFHNPASSTLEPVQAAAWLVAWVHGFHGAVTDGVNVIPGYPREWKLGGISRSTIAVMRAPGIATTWLQGSAVPTAIKQDYSDWINEPAQKTTPTRLLVGSEAGMIHALDAGRWVGRKCDPLHIFGDGCYLDYGTGEEVWGMVPSNLLEDMKFNKTGRQSVTAKIDTTPIVGVIREGNEWRRLAVIAQGENGGSENGRVGNMVWAMDVTSVDNPVPLWEYTHAAMNNIIHPLAMGWAELSGGPEWIVAVNSGVSPITNATPHMYVLNAYEGTEIFTKAVGSDGHSMAGAPALIDADDNGYIDWAYASTSEGILVAQSLKNPSVTHTVSVPNARFFLTPNTEPLGNGKVLVVAVSGDSPLVDDETSTRNRLVAYRHDTSDAAPLVWEYLGDFEFPAGHKAFARPRLVDGQLVLATTTGETFSFCDPDPSDPGNLYLFRNVFALDDIDPGDPDGTGLQYIEGFGSVLAPITVTNGVIRTHQSSRAAFRPDGKFGQPDEYIISIGNVFGVVGWSEPFLDGNF